MGKEPGLSMKDNHSQVKSCLFGRQQQGAVSPGGAGIYTEIKTQTTLP